MDLLPVLTLVIGIVAGFFGDWLRSRFTETGRQKAEREAFQRETLVGLADTVAELTSLAQDAAEERLAGALLPTTETANHRARLKAQSLAMRIDDDLMATTEAVTHWAWVLHHGYADDEGPDISNRDEAGLQGGFIDVLNTFDKDISARLRALYGESPKRPKTH